MDSGRQAMRRDPERIPFVTEVECIPGSKGHSESAARDVHSVEVRQLLSDGSRGIMLQNETAASIESPLTVRSWRSRFALAYCLGDANLGGRLRSLHIRRVLRRWKWRTLVDVGCGISGAMSWGGGIAINPFLIACYHPEACVTGADYLDAVVEKNRALLARASVRNLTFVQLDLRDPRGLDKQDVVVLSDVVANRLGDDALIAGAASLVKHGGYIVLHTFSQRSGVWTGTGYRPGELEALLKSLGFANVRQERTYGIFGRLAWHIHEAFLPIDPALVVLVFPTCLALAVLDTCFRSRRGHGILAVAQKGA